jgi:hypothetical protein
MRRRSLLTGLAFAPLAAQAQTPARSRPMSEMRGGCENFGLDLRAELARFGGPARPIAATPGAPDPAAAPLRPDELADAALLPFGGYQPLSPPAQSRSAEGRFGGHLPILLPGAGRWRISAGPGGSWYDLLDAGGTPQADPWFEMQVGFQSLFKTVVFAVPAGGRFILAINGNRTRQLHILVSADA